MSQRRYNTGPPWPPKQKKHWGDRKWNGSHVCAVCGERIREDKGERAVRHEKRTQFLSLERAETFWTYRHRRCGPKDAVEKEYDHCKQCRRAATYPENCEGCKDFKEGLQ